MLHSAAMLMIFTGCAMTGIGKLLRSREAYLQLMGFRRILEEVIRETAAGRKPIEELLETLGKRENLGILTLVIQSTVAGRRNDPARSVGEYWQMSCRKLRGKIYLKDDLYEKLLNCFAIRSVNPRQWIDYLKELLTDICAAEKSMREEKTQRERLYLAVGFGVGTIGVILLF